MHARIFVALAAALSLAACMTQPRPSEPPAPTSGIVPLTLEQEWEMRAATAR